MNWTRGILIASGLLAMAALLLSLGKDRAAPLRHTPRIPAQTTSAMLSVDSSSRYLLHRGNGELFLDIALRAPSPAPATTRRLPLNLGLVIDRSGSMAGEKLAHAREAARQLVARLHDSDRIAIITYGSDITLLAPSTTISHASRQSLLRLIDTITDRGGTFLSGGLQEARQEVTRHGDRGFVNRVILISDGRANEGLTDQGSLSALASQTLDRGVHVTTMGVGLDFNEEVMTAMAEHGGGHYYFIQDSARLAGFFDRELDTMKSIVAKSASLQLTLDPAVALEHVYGYTYQTYDNGRRIVIRLPDLYGGQSRKIICKLKVPSSREGKHGVATVDLIYSEPQSGAKTVRSSAVEVTLTSDRVLVDQGSNPRVLARVEQVQAASTMHRAMGAYTSGQLHRSRALLSRQIVRTLRANRELKSDALDDLIDSMNQQLEGTAKAPSSAAGRSLVKKSKFEAYKLWK